MFPSPRRVLPLVAALVSVIVVAAACSSGSDEPSSSSSRRPKKATTTSVPSDPGVSTTEPSAPDQPADPAAALQQAWARPDSGTATIYTRGGVPPYLPDGSLTQRFEDIPDEEKIEVSFAGPGNFEVRFWFGTLRAVDGALFASQDGQTWFSVLPEVYPFAVGAQSLPELVTAVSTTVSISQLALASQDGSTFVLTDGGNEVVRTLYEAVTMKVTVKDGLVTKVDAQLTVVPDFVQLTPHQSPEFTMRAKLAYGPVDAPAAPAEAPPFPGQQPLT